MFIRAKIGRRECGFSVTGPVGGMVCITVQPPHFPRPIQPWFPASDGLRQVMEKWSHQVPYTLPDEAMQEIVNQLSPHALDFLNAIKTR